MTFTTDVIRATRNLLLVMYSLKLINGKTIFGLISMGKKLETFIDRQWINCER